MQAIHRWTGLLAATAFMLTVAIALVPDRVFSYAHYFAIICSLLLVALHWQRISPNLTFAYNCFIKPLFSTGKDCEKHQSRLENFYHGQAHIYDVTRRRLLRSRSTLLRLCAAQLKQCYLKQEVDDKQVPSKSYDCIPSPPNSPYLRPIEPAASNKKIVWIDIGGGTGWNVERMNSYIPIEKFHAVFIVDITPSLCEVSRERFSSLGWKNVHVMCMDALKFQLPAEYSNDCNVEVALVTMSYSLSMIEEYFSIVDKVSSMLHKNGILGVVDFGTPSKRCPHDPVRELPYYRRWFWQMWFEIDNVMLSPGRREYLEHKFVTIKSLNCMNRFIGPLVQIPHYVFVGGKADALNLTGFSLGAPLMHQAEEKPCAPGLSLNHFHGHGMYWREPFDPALAAEFHHYLYAFTWEDPMVDLQYLDLKPDDELLVLTSGGCNVLAYAIEGVKRIHSVDMNPCQGHLLELKLAALTALDYEDFWKLFGEGNHPAFAKLLDTFLSPYMSPHALQFWKSNNTFRNFYDTGSSGMAIKAFRILTKIKNLDSTIQRLCSCSTIDEQVKIWEMEVRPHFLDRRWIRMLSTHKFAWDALGVPAAQFEMLLGEGNSYDYAVNTLDPIIRNSLLSRDSYFYHLVLRKSYAGNESGKCPEYLTRKGFETLKNSHKLSAIRIHTKSIAKVLEDDVEPGSLTKAVVMDHMDWFDVELAREEIKMFSLRLKRGGEIYWRSSSKVPWYIHLFEDYGFKVQPLAIRVSERESAEPEWQEKLEEYSDCDILTGEFIDRVNMYASFWMAKLY